MGSMPKVVVTRKLPETIEARLRRDYVPLFNTDDHVYSTDELIDLADGAGALLPCHSEHLDAAAIARLPGSIKAIANFSVGVDHVDLEAAKSRSIIVTDTPDVLSDAAAEIALLLMLGAARRAAGGDRLIRARQWRLWSPAVMGGTQITGKTLGVIGMGRVGQVTARRARGFDMGIHYHNRRRVPAEVEQGAVYHERLETLLAACDVLSLHCPATPATRNLLDAERIRLLRPGAIVVNSARGALIDDEGPCRRRCARATWRRPVSTSSTANRISTRATGNSTTLSCCRISAALPAKLVTPWVSGLWIIWTRFPPAGSRGDRVA